MILVQWQKYLLCDARHPGSNFDLVCVAVDEAVAFNFDATRPLGQQIVNLFWVYYVDRSPKVNLVFPFWMVFLICVNVTKYVRNRAWHNTPFTADFTLHYERFSAAWGAEQQHTVILPFSEFSNTGLDFVFIKLLLTNCLIFDWVKLVETAALVSSRGHKFPQILGFKHFFFQNTRTYRNLSGYNKVWLLLRCKNWVFGFPSVAITISWVRIIVFKIAGWLASEMTRLWLKP